MIFNRFKFIKRSGRNPRETIEPNGQSDSTNPPAPAVLKPRYCLGLALSCGAARGLAHIGVIQVLEENNIPIDLVAGSSMGAYIAAVWGFGLNGQEMAKLAGEINGRVPLWRLVDPVFPPRRGFMRGNAIIDQLRRTIGAARIEHLTRPIRIVATHFDNLERVVFKSGNLARAVHASCAIPGICVPVKIDGEWAGR
ncbi:MAG TPA: hypothetical protein DCY13_14390 [Verrucomicrobiales bacterium]|nr:hypothetical protein [Verrucomicrobiales bacterium]